MILSPHKGVSQFRVLVGILVVLLVVLVAGNVLIPSCGCNRILTNETAAVAALRTYLAAQNQFHMTPFYGEGEPLQYASPWKGAGLPDLYKVASTASGGEKLRLIDRRLAQAKMGGAPRAGYYFYEILGVAGKGPYDFSTDCGLCGYPAEYGKTGRNTFIIDITGLVYQKDTKGAPVCIYPAEPEADGWVLVDSE